MTTLMPPSRTGMPSVSQTVNTAVAWGNVGIIVDNETAAAFEHASNRPGRVLEETDRADFITVKFSRIAGGRILISESVHLCASASHSRITIPPIAFLKTCWLLFWNTIRHPFQTTIIDMMTGEVVSRKG